MTKEQVLKSLTFGSVDSESEENLDKIFIQTNNFDEFLNPNTALLLGCKGAGKSALFRLFSKYESSARDMANHRIDDVYLVSGIGFKDVAEMDDMKLLNQIESGAISSEAAWKIYITYKLIYSLYNSYKVVCGENGRRVLQKAEVIPDYRITALIRKLYSRFVGEPPRINQIDFANISISLSENNSVSIYDLLNEINSHLTREGKTFTLHWLMIPPERLPEIIWIGRLFWAHHPDCTSTPIPGRAEASGGAEEAQNPCQKQARAKAKGEDEHEVVPTLASTIHIRRCPGREAGSIAIYHAEKRRAYDRKTNP